MKETKKNMYLVIKRLFDFCASVVFLLVTIWIFVIIAILIKLQDGGPIFYKQLRVGQYGKPLYIYKFRTMIENASDIKSIFTPEQLKLYEQEFKLDDDPRVTKLGKFLRKTSLDELPQLLNIIKGDLSVVGPRPILEDEMAKHYTIEEQEKFKQIQPGLTGFWQAYARNNATYTTGERQRMEMYYIDHATILLDIKIIFKTVETVIRKTGAM